MPDGLSVNTDELNRLAIDLGRKADGMDSRTSMIVRKAAFDIEARAKQLAPVRTGFLRNSIGAKFTGQGFRLYSAEVVAEAFYASYVEHGTSRMAPRPFMGPALDAVMPGFVAAMAAVADPLDPR